MSNEQKCVKCGHEFYDPRRRGADEFNSFCVKGCGCECIFPSSETATLERCPYCKRPMSSYPCDEFLQAQMSRTFSHDDAVQPPVTQDSSETAGKHPYYVHVRNCHSCSGPNGYCSEGLRLLRMPTEMTGEINFHKFVGVGAGELGMTPCGRCGALERDLIHTDKFRKTTGEGVPERAAAREILKLVAFHANIEYPQPEYSTRLPLESNVVAIISKHRARAYSPSEIPSSTFALLKWQLEKISEHPCPMCADCIEILGNDIVPIVDSIIERLAASPSGRPCSACGDGDTAMKYHSHDASPSVDEADKVLFGELWLDAQGEAHFICHTKDDDFAKTKDAFQKFIALLEGQLRNEKECPFYSADSVDEAARRIINQARVEELEALDICEFCQVPISAGRHNEPTFNVCGTCYNQTVNSLNAKVSQLEQERDALKRGEFICKKCGLRKDGEYDRDGSF